MLAVAGLSSCSDSFLDKQPDERITISNEDQVSELITGSYPSVNYSWIAELSSDNLIDNQTPHLPSSPQDNQVLAHYNYSSYARWNEQIFRFEPATQSSYSDYDSPGMLWEGYYQSVSGINYALQAIDKLAKENGGTLTPKLQAAKAEALLVRAYDHFCLVNVFSPAFKDSVKSKEDVGVPYVTGTYDVVQTKAERGNVADDYKNIIKDVEDALPYVSDQYYSAPKYHFNTAAAHAFAARVYLFAHEWEKCIEQADQVLGTDSATMATHMMDYSVFSNCSSMSDYGNAWQNPDLNNNLMLLTTSSLLQRECFGYRYSLAGPNAQQVLMFYNNSSLWPAFTGNPISFVSGMLFSSSSHDYGFISTKIAEQFEYSDKRAGIGYPHIILRAFTGNELLLERAEAKAMLGRTEDAYRDLELYWNISLNSFTATDKTQFNVFKENDPTVSRPTPHLTKAIIDRWWGDPTNNNCFADWSFTQNLSSSYVVPQNAVSIMNFINDFRRYETCFEGLRFFDLKRWGIEYSHTEGVNSTEYKLTSTDARRAIEIPWEVLSSGMESSRPKVSDQSPADEAKAPSPDAYVVKTNDKK